MSEQLHSLHVNGTTPRRRRRLARREPAVRAARAARPARRQGRVRAGRVRLVQRARRRRAGLLVPRAGGERRRRADHRPSRASPSRARRPTCSGRSSTPAPCSAASARRGWSMAAHALLDRTPAPDAHRDPRGAVGQHLPLHRLRPAHRRRAAGRRRAGRRRVVTLHRRRRPDRAVGTGRIGDSPARPDGIIKAQGTFAFSSDLPIDGAAWGATLRSPHPYARIVVDRHVARRGRSPGVATVITAADVPGQPTYGLIAADQPVFATEYVRYVGEPVAAVAADHPETCRRALAAIDVDLRGARAAARPGGGDRRQPPADPPRRQRPAPPAHPLRRRRRHRRRRRRGHVRDRHAGPGVPRPRGGASPSPTTTARGVELHIATQWLHEDRKQIAACLGLPEEQVRLVLGGVGGAFGAREDISLQVHTLPAGAAPRPAGAHGLQPGRELPRPRPPPPGDDLDAPPRHGRRRDRQDRGPLRARRRRLRVDVVGRAAQRASPTPRARTAARTPSSTGYAVRTNHLPCGAMRGFGVVQACFAHEGQMDRLAAACGLDPVEIRLRNAMEHRRPADHRAGRRERRAGRPLHPRDRGAADARRADRRGARRAGALDPMRLPGGAGLTADVGHVRRGVGCGVAIKNLMYSEGFDDYSTARCRLADGVATLKFATSEVGQGFVTIAQQIARTVLGVDVVVLDPIDTADRLGRLDVGVAPDVDERRRRRRRLPGRARAAVRARRRGARHRPAALRHRRHRRRRLDGRPAGARRRRHRRACTSTRPSSTTTARPRSSTTTARATATRRSPSSPTAPSSTSTPSSASSRSSRSPRPRTSGGRSTRCRCSARSRAASPRASGWR